VTRVLISLWSATLAERGAEPKVHPVRKTVLKALSGFFTPLLPDDYIEMINPLWTTRELRGRIERVDRETEDAVTVVIKPGFKWEGHEPGQYLRIGVVVDGVHHWRAYSLTSDPDHPDGLISITPKLVPDGKVSPFFVQQCEKGAVVRLGGVEGQFKLPDPPPEKILFISAGSGITPVMSMVRHLARAGQLKDVVHLHSAREEKDVIFGEQLREFDAEHDGYRLDLRFTSKVGRLEAHHLDELCSDWRDREAFVCGPGEMIDTMEEHWKEHGDPDRMHFERFQPVIGGQAAEGAEGGTIKFTESDKEVECDGGTPILVAGEDAGLELPFGCRMGVCHTCIGTLESGRVRDLRSGEISGNEGETIRTCVNAPEGAVEIAL
jgi:ferredoxin-NADP reductase